MMDCQVVELDRETAGNYKMLTLGPYQHYLERIAAGGPQVLAAGLNFLGLPVGLALACQNTAGSADIISLLIQEDFRGRGYAGSLLDCLGAMAQKQGIPVLKTGYSSGNPYAAQIERVLRKAGFSLPLVTSTVYRYSSKGVAEDGYPWFIRFDLPAMPEGFIRWQDVTFQEREQLKRQAWFPEYLSPFIDEHLLEPLNSLAYRVDGEIAAWLITHRLRSDAVLYKSFYVREDLRNAGIAALMLIKAIRLQFEQGISEYLLTIHNQNYLVLPMVKRWMKGFTVLAHEWKQAVKKF
jgi:GNAT superfamily N-acetyltransferase